MSRALVIPCDQSYLPGLKTLLKSIEITNPNHKADIVIISDDIDSVPGCKIIRPCLSSYVGIDTSSFPVAAWFFFEALKLDYDHVILAGADQLIVNRWPLLYDELPSFGAIPEWGVVPPKQYKDTFMAFCSGSLVIEPSLDVYNNLITIAKRGFRGDQDVFNEWAFLNETSPVEFPYWYDTSKRWFVAWKDKWNESRDSIASVHFVGKDKPWMDNEDKRYSELNNVWRSYASGTPIPLPEAV